ncbi:MAG: AmmeMemoRadiSam system protein B, partial [Proteobacteria bacterium]|nr:AmmeMemoRadiSam system protein B [Pseudomonadota bacterium]
MSALAVFVRPPAVAGMFYSGSMTTLDAEVRDYLSHTVTTAASAPKALIVPHAGYVYSAPVAASAYACLASARTRIRRVVLLGPTHRVAIRGLALPDAAAFATPLGSVQLDAELVRAVESLPQVQQSREVHAMEHSLEVQLPFLQVALDEFSLLPLAVGMASAEEVAEVLDRVWGGPETLILISSDLSHYHSYTEAQRIDQETARQILALQPLANHEQACGATPVNGL